MFAAGLLLGAGIEIDHWLRLHWGSIIGDVARVPGRVDEAPDVAELGGVPGVAAPRDLATSLGSTMSSKFPSSSGVTRWTCSPLATTRIPAPNGSPTQIDPSDDPGLTQPIEAEVYPRSRRRLEPCGEPSPTGPPLRLSRLRAALSRSIFIDAPSKVQC